MRRRDEFVSIMSSAHSQPAAQPQDALHGRVLIELLHCMRRCGWELKHQSTWALKRWLRRAAMTMGGCCLAMRTCRLSSCARSRPRAVLFLRAHTQPSRFSLE